MPTTGREKNLKFIDRSSRKNSETLVFGVLTLWTLGVSNRPCFILPNCSISQLQHSGDKRHSCQESHWWQSMRPGWWKIFWQGDLVICWEWGLHLQFSRTLLRETSKLYSAFRFTDKFWRLSRLQGDLNVIQSSNCRSIQILIPRMIGTGDDQISNLQMLDHTYS